MKVWKIFSHSNVTVFRIVQLWHQINVSINDENRFKECPIAVPLAGILSEILQCRKRDFGAVSGGSRCDIAHLHEKISGEVEN
jgi:hypothetical protein